MPQVAFSTSLGTADELPTWSSPHPRKSARRQHFLLPGGLRLPLYASHALDRVDLRIERAVIVIHGYEGDAKSYFSRMRRVTRAEAVSDRTLVIAPRFSVAADACCHGDREVYWKHQKSWKRGDLSSRNLVSRISSFSAMDAILAYLGAGRLFPNLGALSIVGHSAGGQFVQRYAAGHPDIEETAGLRIRYVAANPGTYLYLNAHRRAGAGSEHFAIPNANSVCPGYNRYQYGLEGLNRYMRNQGEKSIVERMRRRDIVILLGAADDDPDHHRLDRSCRSDLQGLCRVERGLVFKAHLDRFFAPHNTRLVRVPGVGHSSAEMFQSIQGCKSILG